MREVTCESGNTYALALGPQILESITGSYEDLVPTEIFEKIQEYALRHEESSMDIFTNEEKMQQLQDENILTPHDAVKLVSSQRNHNLKTVKKCLRKMNDDRIFNHPYFKEESLENLSRKEKEEIFFEEVMPSEDYSKIMDEINKAVFEFRFGLDIQEKSKLLSSLKEMKGAKKEILQSESLN